VVLSPDRLHRYLSYAAMTVQIVDKVIKDWLVV